MDKHKIRIIFIMPNLSTGGAERIMIFLSKNLDSNFFDSSFLVTGFESETTYCIDNLEIVYLNKTRVLLAAPKIIQYLKKEQPQIVMSSLSHLNTLMGLISILFPKTRFIGRETSIRKVNYNHRGIGFKQKILQQIQKWGIKQLDFIVCQSFDMFLDFKKKYSVHEDKLAIIHNPITETFQPKKTYILDSTKTINFITVGRLEVIKGHTRIIDILSKVKYPFKYTIIGNGPEKDNLIRTIKFYGLENKVNFIDFTSNVASFLQDSDYFLQGSFSEGFPNALLESCAVGTPAIAFDAPGGTREIVENGINGFIAKDENEFLQHLNNLKRFDPNSVSNSVYSKFDKSIILEDYKSFFLNIMKSK